MLLQLKMDEEDIDGWYEEEKQKLLDQYLAGIESHNREEAEKAYNEKLSTLMAKYNQMMSNMLESMKKSKSKGFISNLRKIIKLK